MLSSVAQPIGEVYHGCSISTHLKSSLLPSAFLRPRLFMANYLSYQISYTAVQPISSDPVLALVKVWFRQH